MRLSLDSATVNDRGAVLLIGAAAMTAIIMVAALVIDLGMVRADRVQNRSAADTIATAGAFALGEGGGVTGCESAAGYANELLGPVDLSCSGFASSCDGSTAPATAVATADDITITLTYPVANSSELLTPTSDGTQDLTAMDGDPCDRFGVAIEQRQTALFSRLMGQETIGSKVHSVAKAGRPDGPGDLVSLLLLEPQTCPALQVSGGGSDGGVYVSAAINEAGEVARDPETGEISPGRIAVDSDGSSGCSSAISTITTNGRHANIYTQGDPEDCATENELGGGWGCGEIETVAAGAPGCYAPACSGAAGTVSPPPSAAGQPRTRAPFDWRYNCKPSYPELDIDGCNDDTGTQGPYLDDLTVWAESDSSYSYYSDEFPCKLKPGDEITVQPGNWLIDCYPLSVKGELTFEGGNLIVDGGIDLSSGAQLNVNTNNPDEFYGWSPGSTVDILEHSNQAAFIFFRDGALSKAGQASVNFQHTMVYFSEYSGFDMTGGTGGITWTAPTDGPFKDLTLWSEATSVHKLGGSVILDIEGIIFVPNATMQFQGNGGISGIRSQVVAKSLVTGGNGGLKLSPVMNQSVRHDTVADSQLIR